MALPAIPLVAKVGSAAGIGGYLTGALGSSDDDGGIPNPLEDTRQMLNLVLVFVAVAAVGQLFDIQLGGS